VNNKRASLPQKKRKITVSDVMKALRKAKIDRELRVFIVNNIKGAIELGCCSSGYSHIWDEKGAIV